MATARKKSAASSSASTEAVRVGKFGLIGIINTVIDFAILNVLVSVFGMYIVAANVISTSTAMLFSFVANRTFVFDNKNKDVVRQAVLFFAVTAFGLWGIQSSIIIFLTDIWTWPLDFAYDVVELVGLDGTFSQEFVQTNATKAAATLASLTWNYIMYKRFVFKDDKRKK